MKLHVVWDWNGTLLDDLDLVVRSVSASIGRFGHPPITHDDYRDHYTRPVRRFYESLFGRPVDDMEWIDLNKTFHDLYYSGVDEVALAPDAIEALEQARARGWTQSLLSMSREAPLVDTVRAHGIDRFFTKITGLKEPDGALKASYLEAHLATQDIDPGTTLVIGDTPDDAAAAHAVGSRAILYDGGSHHLDVLEATGVVVVDSLPAALVLGAKEAAA